MNMNRSIVVLIFLIVALVGTGLVSGAGAFPVLQDSTTEDADDGDWMRNWAAIPVINYDRSLDIIFGAIAMRFFRLDSIESQSPPSAVGAGGFYTTNDTWAWLLFSRLSFKEDRYRCGAAVGSSSINFQFYFDMIPGWGQFIDYNTAAHFAYVSAMRETVENIYVGVHYIFLGARTKFDLPVPLPGEDDYDYNHGLGLKTEYDTRDNIYNARKGFYASLETVHYREWLGSDEEYNSFKFSFSMYQEFSEDKVVAGKLYSAVTTGDVPFYSQKMVGRDDIRGYSEGKYRGEHLYALQTEYRWNFHGKWGMVAFGGIAAATDRIGDIRLKDILPGGGIGIRFTAVPDEDINIGIDVAAGKDDWGLYFRIGEAF
jgi:outer membrane protein assembly factor BamA